MEDNKMLKLVYTFFLGLLLAIFIGVGINTFYVAPEAPEYPIGIYNYGKEPSDEQLATERAFEEKSRQHDEDMKPYSRNVSIITLAGSVVLLAVSLIYEKKMKFIADGVMLGGLFTLFYSIIRSFVSEDSKFVFATVTTGLVVVVYLGYHRFVRVHSLSTTKPKK